MKANMQQPQSASTTMFDTGVIIEDQGVGMVVPRLWNSKAVRINELMRLFISRRDLCQSIVSTTAPLPPVEGRRMK